MIHAYVQAWANPHATCSGVGKSSEVGVGSGGGGGGVGGVVWEEALAVLGLGVGLGGGSSGAKAGVALQERNPTCRPFRVWARTGVKDTVY